MRLPTIAAAGLGVILASALAGGQEQPKAASEAMSLKQKVSYAIGLDMGKRMKNQAVELEPDVLAQGIKDGLAGQEKLTPEQIQQAMQEFQRELQGKQQELASAKAKEAEAYLAENKKQPGVTTRPSGLQYSILREGTGRTPKATDTVSANYEGKLTDGTVFDSSYKRGQPLSIPVNRVIRGWSEALQSMKEGSKWHLVIPPDLAYGATPPPGSPIPPNAVLVFDVELLRIEQPGGATPPGGR
ncbi:MAG: FKBP-type peptidyl-prolyl cis-trans isomerase [Planctomycetaceae bacterium]|nr:FKBP-type peptidyl-prolyl cis-trans isomerase [Planctomycetaceae bacterium]